MKTIVLDYRNVRERKTPLALCLGYFDGIHLGHEKIILTARAESDLTVGVLTFDQPISKFIGNGKSTSVLTSVEDRARLLARLGVDRLYILKIDAAFAELSPDEFIEKVLRKLNVREVYSGTDYRFGRKAEGTPALLSKYFRTRTVSLYDIEGKKVSTSRIKMLLKEGNVEKAGELLGRTYELKGTVVSGEGFGSTIGYPTANLELDADYVIPKYGVYKTLCYVSGVPHLSITNVGVHPSVGELPAPVVEVHIPGIRAPLYGRTLYVDFLSFVRPEKKFSSPEELKEQIDKDLASLGVSPTSNK